METTRMEAAGGVPCLLRLVWFVFVGWWASGIWIALAWLLNLSILGLPFGLFMLNRVPLVMTLQSPRAEWLVTRDGSNTEVMLLESGQLPILLRAIYFVLVGWWVSLVWCLSAYVLCLTWVGLPLGLLMFNMVGLVTTLRRR